MYTLYCHTNCCEWLCYLWSVTQIIHTCPLQVLCIVCINYFILPDKNILDGIDFLLYGFLDIEVMFHVTISRSEEDEFNQEITDKEKYARYVFISTSL